MNEDKDKIQWLAERYPFIVLHESVTHMQQLMSSCDVAISAAGSTLYELCATQTPTITYILADNQIPGAESFEKRGILACAGDIRNLGAEILAEKLINCAIILCKDYKERKRISEAMKLVVDGYGAERIVEEIMSINT